MYHIGFGASNAYIPYVAVVINSIVNIYIMRKASSQLK